MNDLAGTQLAWQRLSFIDVWLLQIWDIADEANTGSLNMQGFCVALKLIACQQHGKEPAKPLLSTGKIHRPIPLLKRLLFRAQCLLMSWRTFSRTITQV